MPLKQVLQKTICSSWPSQTALLGRTFCVCMAAGKGPVDRELVGKAVVDDDLQVLP
jgi:hypothetical protein